MIPWYQGRRKFRYFSMPQWRRHLREEEHVLEVQQARVARVRYER